MYRRPIAPALSLLVLSSTATAVEQLAKPAGETVRILVPTPGGRPALTLQAFLYRPAGTGRHPLVVLSHGSSGGQPRQAAPQAEQARFFTDRGYAVLVPMRRGRGASGGVSLKSEERNCDPRSWQAGLRSAYDDLSAAIDFGFRLPDVDPSRLVLAGESRGGFLSVAYAAEGVRRRRVGAVINFVGGWVAEAEDHCPIDFNRLAFRRYGARSIVSELWLYGDRDRFYANASVRSYPKAFRAAGGIVTFTLIHGVPDNGHWLPGFPDMWSRPVDRYLRARGLPSGAP